MHNFETYVIFQQKILSFQSVSVFEKIQSQKRVNKFPNSKADNVLSNF